MTLILNGQVGIFIVEILPCLVKDIFHELILIFLILLKTSKEMLVGYTDLRIPSLSYTHLTFYEKV